MRTLGSIARMLVASALALGCSSEPTTHCCGDVCTTGEPVPNCVDVGWTCRSDANCGNAGLCNIAAHLCLPRCRSTSDCGSGQSVCEKLPTTSGPVCVCTTDALCGGGSAYCNRLDLLCETRCSDDSGCLGYSTARTCQHGQCLPGFVDGGPSCGGMHPCTTGNYCSASNSTCVAGASNCGVVDTRNFCNWGEVCRDDPSVSSFPVCERAIGCATAAQTTPVPEASPVVFDVTATGNASAPSTVCSSGSIINFQGSFYDPQPDVPTGSGAAAFNAIRFATATALPALDGGGNTSQSVSIDGASQVFTFQLCSDLRGTAAAIFLVDEAGNASNTACLGSF